MALPPEDQKLLQQAMDGLKLDPEAMGTLLSTLDTTTTEIEIPVSGVKPAWFGQSFTGGYRLATNADLAHDAVRDELAKMVAGLTALSEGVGKFTNDMETVTDDTAVAFTQFYAATECVTAPTFDGGQCTLPTNED